MWAHNFMVSWGNSLKKPSVCINSKTKGDFLCRQPQHLLSGPALPTPLRASYLAKDTWGSSEQREAAITGRLMLSFVTHRTVLLQTVPHLPGPTLPSLRTREHRSTAQSHCFRLEILKPSAVPYWKLLWSGVFWDSKSCSFQKMNIRHFRKIWNNTDLLS